MLTIGNINIIWAFLRLPTTSRHDFPFFLRPQPWRARAEMGYCPTKHAPMSVFRPLFNCSRRDGLYHEKLWVSDSQSSLTVPFDESVLDVKSSIAHVRPVCTSESGITYKAEVDQAHAIIWHAASLVRRQIRP
jgi:hypothetical protein